MRFHFSWKVQLSFDMCTKNMPSQTTGSPLQTSPLDGRPVRLFSTKISDLFPTSNKKIQLVHTHPSILKNCFPSKVSKPNLQRLEWGSLHPWRPWICRRTSWDICLPWPSQLIPGSDGYICPLTTGGVVRWGCLIPHVWWWKIFGHICRAKVNTCHMDITSFEVKSWKLSHQLLMVLSYKVYTYIILSFVSWAHELWDQGAHRSWRIWVRSALWIWHHWRWTGNGARDGWMRMWMDGWMQGNEIVDGWWP